MTLEQQVVSLDLAKRMKELGFKQESYFSHDITRGKVTTSSYTASHPTLKSVSAYTVAELGEMLPFGISYELLTAKGEKHWNIGRDGLDIRFVADTEADARAKMLIYLAEKEIINPSRGV